MTIFMTVVVWLAIITIFVAVFHWATELMTDARLDREEAAKLRKEYQRRIRVCIMNMMDGPLQHEDLEWHLHSLLYEYRHVS